MQQNDRLKRLNEIISLESSRYFPGKRVIHGEGKENAELFLIGEAPGGDEEREGRPFVGKSGKNLTNFLSTIGLDRSDLYITNVVKIRPIKLSEKTGKPVNRPPDLSEKELFSPYLYKEIEIIKPKVIVTLGNVPLQAVLKDKRALIGNYHGNVICFGGMNIFPLYHPAAVIYNGKLKHVYNEDILKLREYLDVWGEKGI
ncbi:MAG: uracil-DNA glycosylase [Clostridiales bacterium]|nr:uracil-DNA glycosylase [Clostridiales bacterium]